MWVGRATPLRLPPLPAPSLQPDSEQDPLLPAAGGAGRRGRRGGRGEVCFKKGRVAGAARVLATWERARRQRRGGRKVGSPDVSAGRAGRPRSRETTSVGQSAGRRGALAATPPATRPATPGRLAGMDSAAAAFALDKPALGPGPPPPPALGPGDCAQARKNFTVSHLLDLEEVAAAGRLAARPAGAEAREGAAREPSGGSSGSEAAPQDGECGPGGGRGGRGNGTWGPGLAGSKGQAERPGASAAGSQAGKEGAPAETLRVAGPPRGCGRPACAVGLAAQRPPLRLSS